MTALRMAELARSLMGVESVASLLQMVVEAAVREIPGAEHAGITVLGSEGATTPASTDEAVERVDAAQYDAGEGPCLDAAVLGRGGVVRVEDMAGDQRWPKFAPAATRLGVRSMMSLHLVAQQGETSALNLYAEHVAAFPAEAEEIAAPLAAHAATAIAVTDKKEQLNSAIHTRDGIGQAKGILMERYKLTAEEAFTLLIAASQRNNVKLRDVAEHLAATGELLAPHN